MNEKETTWQEDVDTLLALLEELTPEEEEEIRRDPAATAALRRLYDAIADTLGKK